MTASNTVPFLDLVSPHRDLTDELTTVFQDALKTASFVGGHVVEEFERDFAKFCEAHDSYYTDGRYYAVWTALGFTATNNDAEEKLNTSTPMGINCNAGIPFT